MALIIAFPNRTRPEARLLPRDKAELCRWEDAVCASGAVSRVVIHDEVPVTEAERADFVLVYGPGSAWANWGLARGAGGLLLWSCRNGTDLGMFPAMTEALVALDRQIALDRPAALAAGEPASSRVALLVPRTGARELGRSVACDGGQRRAVLLATGQLRD